MTSSTSRQASKNSGECMVSSGLMPWIAMLNPE